MAFTMKRILYIAAVILGTAFTVSCESKVEQPAKDVLAGVLNEYENGKRVYSRQENSLLGGFEDHDVEEHYYLYRGTAGTVFGRDETGAAV